MTEAEVRKILEEAEYWKDYPGSVAQIIFRDVPTLCQEVLRLRAALESIAANTCCDKCQEAALVARAALAGEERK